MAIRIAQFLWHELLYAGHLQAAGAAGIVYVAARWGGIPVTLGLIAVPYLVLQAIYWHDRYHHHRRDAATNRLRTQHQARYHGTMPLLMGLYGTAALSILILQETIEATIFMIVILAAGYFYPLLLKDVTKVVPLFKNIYVALVFALLPLFPLLTLEGGIALLPSFASLMIFLFVEAMVMQIILDVKDVRTDEESALQTVPALLGTRRTLMALLWINAGVLLLVLVSVTYRWVPSVLLPLAVGLTLYNVYVVYLMSRAKRSGLILASSMFLLLPIIMLASLWFH